MKKRMDGAVTSLDQVTIDLDVGSNQSLPVVKTPNLSASMTM